MIDTSTIAIAWAASATGMGIVLERVCAFRLKKSAVLVDQVRAENTSLVLALRDEETEGAHFRELADDALANIEGLREDVRHLKAECGRHAAALLAARNELRKIHAEREEAAARRAAHMRSIAIIGNQSPKRRKQAAA